MPQFAAAPPDLASTALRTPPLPLLDPDRRLMIIWSAKAACSTTFVWFAHLVGMLPALRSSGLSPHDFRQAHYLRSDLYSRGLALPASEYRIVHVIRDPCDRAVSSYRHALRTAYLERDPAGVRSGLDRRAGFSFLRYLDFLSGLDLARADIHHRVQHHPVEEGRAPDQVINVSTTDLLTALDQPAADYGIGPLDQASLDGLQQFEAKRRASPSRVTSEDASAFPFDMQAAQGKRPWPESAQLLTDTARGKIAKLYAKDYAFFSAQLFGNR